MNLADFIARLRAMAAESGDAVVFNDKHDKLRGVSYGAQSLDVGKAIGQAHADGAFAGIASCNCANNPPLSHVLANQAGVGMERQRLGVLIGWLRQDGYLLTMGKVTPANLADVLEKAARSPSDGAVNASRSSADKPDTSTAPMSATDLATTHGLDHETLRKRLERVRKKNLECYIEMDDGERKPRDAKYLYRPQMVQHVIDAMKREQATGERPAK